MTVTQAVLLAVLIFLCAVTIAFLCARNNPRVVRRTADCPPEEAESAAQSAAQSAAPAGQALQWPTVAAPDHATRLAAQRAWGGESRHTIRRIVMRLVLIKNVSLLFD